MIFREKKLISGGKNNNRWEISHEIPLKNVLLYGIIDKSIYVYYEGGYVIYCRRGSVNNIEEVL